MINTQIASYLAPGSVTWLFYADRLMEFPGPCWGGPGRGAHPQLTAAKAAGTRRNTRPCWTGACASWCCWPCPVPWRCSPCQTPGGHLVPLRQAGRHRCGADCRGVGWLWGGLAGPGGHQGAGARLLRQPGCAHPVKIAIVVLVITQILNAVLVPLIDHAGWPCRLAWGLWSTRCGC